MFRYFLYVVLAFSLISCKKCEMYNKALDLSANAVASVLECSGIPAIRADLEKAIEGLEICNKEIMVEGALADALCPHLADWLVIKTKEQIPPNWQCKAKKTGDALRTAILYTCKQMPI